jgi:hypothetical protein
MFGFDSESSILFTGNAQDMLDWSQSSLFHLQWLLPNHVASEFADLLLSSCLRLRRRCAGTMGRHRHSNFMIDLHQWQCDFKM